jgi:hypothetical protein
VRGPGNRPLGGIPRAARLAQRWNHGSADQGGEPNICTPQVQPAGVASGLGSSCPDDPSIRTGSWLGEGNARAPDAH